MKITFHGAARTVTGSKHLLTTESGKKILLDCGLFQGHGKDTDALNRTFNFNPEEIDVLILSHAHIDHSGNIPNLVKHGFKGKIICTPATKELCEVMLADTAHIQENDLRYVNQRRIKRGEPPFSPIYDMHDVEASLKLFHTVDFNETYKLNDEAEFHFTENGHILGSAAVNISVKTKNGERKIFFSGDIGRYNDKIMKPPMQFPQADYILCESTYGNKLHATMQETEHMLFETVLETCVMKKGKIIIPAFSLGRTQEVVYALNNLRNHGKIPPIKVYVDSPLSYNATEIMRNNLQSFNKEIQKSLLSDPDPFGFAGLTYIREVAESKKLNDHHEPCIIISASGMAEAGRIKHHIRNNISNPKNTILIVGYCTPLSLGGRLAEGNKTVRIFGDEYEVKAKVKVIDEYSAHADYKEMLRYLSCQDKNAVKKVFLVHGEYEGQMHWKQTLLDNGFSNVEIPEMKSEWEV